MAKDHSDQEYIPRVADYKTKKIVLVIDDDPDILELASAALACENEVRTVTAASAHEAVTLLQHFPVDAILTDIQLPEMTGLEFLEHVRSLGFATPFVLMSGFVDSERALKAMRLGVIDILQKPFHTATMRAALLRALNVGASIRRVQEDFAKFCSDRKLDLRYVDILSCMGIFLAQQELRLFTADALTKPDMVPVEVEMVPPVVHHEFDAFTYSGQDAPDLSSMLEHRDELT